MLSSLAVTYVNIVIGAVSRIPEEVALDTLYPNVEKVLFDILVIGANVLVILILLDKHIIYFILFFFTFNYSLAFIKGLLLSLHWIGINFKIANP